MAASDTLGRAIFWARGFARRRWPALALIGGWAAMVLIAWPAGEFAINDDWGFSTPVRWLVEERALQFTHWQAMTLLAQILIGAAWTSLVGFSHMNLRLLGVVIAAATLLLGFVFARRQGLSPRAAFVAAGLLAASPLFTAVSMSFMTDTPYLFFTIAAALALTRAAQEGPAWRRDFAIGAALLVTAVLIRQTGVVIAAAVIAGDFVRNGLTRASLARAAILAALGAGALIGFSALAHAIGELPAPLAGRNSGIREFLIDALQLKRSAVKYFTGAVYWGAVYVGLYAAPLVLAGAVATARGALPGRAVIAFAGFAALFLVLMIASGENIPRGNVLGSTEIGPLLVAPWGPGAAQGRVFDWPLAIAAAAGMATLAVLFIAGAQALWRVIRVAPDRDRFAALATLALLAGLSYLPYCVYYGAWVDRYVTVSAYFAVVLAFAAAPRADAMIARHFAPAAAAIAAGALFSSVMVRDYFVWARAREALIERAISAYGAAPLNVDGGFEYVNVEALRAAPRAAAPRALVPVAHMDFVVTSQPIEGFEVLEQRAPRRLVGPPRRLYLLRRE